MKLVVIYLPSARLKVVQECVQSCIDQKYQIVKFILSCSGLCNCQGELYIYINAELDYCQIDNLNKKMYIITTLLNTSIMSVFRLLTQIICMIDTVEIKYRSSFMLMVMLSTIPELCPFKI